MPPVIRSKTLVIVGLAVALSTAACGSAATSSSPVGSAIPTVAASAVPTVAASAAPAAGQTDTEWGRIWDTLPSRFPKVPGAVPAEEGATGPATANLAVDGVDAHGVIALLETLLKQAGYTATGSSQPLENGGAVLEMSGPAAGCRVQVTAAPAGSLTMVTVLYGAGCPHD